eukprot:TRINITY_DN9881_c0_g1_i4.p2 TRINITY_DN9881_c0_g1~~TRINITY_DN9881_c0_g1_i4.p2  ORF type:complete len:167 (+),score=59.97 TRINITY_DN9881_c0_g1_i4:182-682(+)
MMCRFPPLLVALAAMSWCGVEAFVPAAPIGHRQQRTSALAARVAPPSNTWSESLEAVAARLDDFIWGRHWSDDAAAAADDGTAQALDEELLRRRSIRGAVVETRRRCLALEAELTSLLRIAGARPSRTELGAIHRAAAELEAVAAATGAAEEGGEQEEAEQWFWPL